MRLTLLFRVLLSIVFVVSSCKSYNPHNYRAQLVSDEKKIVNLQFVPPPKEELSKLYYAELQNGILGLHRAGLDSLCNNSDEKYGYYTFEVNGAGGEVKGIALMYPSALTLGVLNLLGMPCMYFETELEINFYIYDSKKNLIANYITNINPKKTKAWVAPYYGYGMVTGSQVSFLKAHKLAFEEFSMLVSKDIEAINRQLLSGGTIRVEKSTVIGNTEETIVTLDPNREIDKEKGSGTGFLISENGYVVTNYHVVEDARKIELYFPTDSITKKYMATVVSTDKTNDIAILKIDSGFIQFANIPYTFSDDYNVSDEVFTIGYPQPDIMGASYKYTRGEISSLSGIENNTTMMQITTPMQPGNSGGPLFNKNGDVVGITTSTINPFYTARYQGNIPQNVNYAVKSDYIKPIAKQYTGKQQNSIAAFPLAEQIIILNRYVCMIKTY